MVLQLLRKNPIGCYWVKKLFQLYGATLDRGQQIFFFFFCLPRLPLTTTHIIIKNWVKSIDILRVWANVNHVQNFLKLPIWSLNPTYNYFMTLFLYNI